MRKACLAISVALALVPAAFAGTLKIIPTTTFSAETSNNTSTASTFKAQTNGNLGPGNVSKVDIHSLMYPGTNTKVIAHLMPWWGDPRHIDVGYSSHDPNQIHSQITDMISRGVDGVIIDWYGDKDYTDQTAKLVMAEAELHPGFTFAIMVDKGAIALSPCSGCNSQQTLIHLVQYVEQTYVPSSAYMRVNGRPVITNFDIDLHYTIDWKAVAAAASTNPDFIFQHAAGFTHTVSGGSYAWVIVNVTDYGMAYLSKFYNAALAAPSEYAIGGGYKGFNDTLASWGTGRIVGQQCGQTWLQTFAQINNFYSSGNQLDAVQLVTWNDYEEGTEIESGIDNCVSISAKRINTALQWTPTGNENTIDHYVVYISTDGKNLMLLTTVQPGSHSLDLGSYQLAPGNYIAYVQAVGKPTMINHMSGAVNYTVAASSSGGGNGGGGNGGGGTTSGSISLGATPTALTLAPGQSGNANLTITPVSGPVTTPVVLSCSGLPAGTSCAFSANSVTPGSSPMSAVITITAGTITATAAGTDSRKRQNPAGGLLFSGLGVMAIAVSGSWYTRNQIRKGVLLAGLALLLCVLSACGGGSPLGFQSSTAQVRSGTFSVTISGDSGSQHSSTVIALTIE